MRSLIMIPLPLSRWAHLVAVCVPMGSYGSSVRLLTPDGTPGTAVRAASVARPGHLRACSRRAEILGRQERGDDPSDGCKIEIGRDRCFAGQLAQGFFDAEKGAEQLRVNRASAEFTGDAGASGRGDLAPLAEQHKTR